MTAAHSAARPGGYEPDALAAACSWLLAAMGLVVLDVRVERIDLLSDPVGFAVAVEGARRLRRSSPRTAWSALLVALSPLAVVASAVSEVGLFLHGEATGLTASAGLPAEAPMWVGRAAVATAAFTAIGVVVLARHMRAVLEGIPSDRWRQVTIAWVGFVVLGVAALATGALELVLVAAATGVTAAVLLVLSVLATRRFVEEGGLGAAPGSEALR